MARLTLITKPTSDASIDQERLEVNLLLSGIKQRYGYDFTHYSQASLRRRLHKAREYAQVANFTELLAQLLHREDAFDDFLKCMSITVTAMFRDPLFYKALREHIVPRLKTYPYIKIWHAGCATGEEVYSMAVLLHEEGFLDRTRIYATDFNKHSLTQGERGIYPIRHMPAYENHYREAGGIGDFSDYYSTAYEHAKFKDFLKERITFSYHNLVTDGVFGEMNLICCRNVLIYFDKTLQDQVLTKFTESLRHGGILCLGAKESINFTSVKSQFEVVDAKHRIFKRHGAAYG